MTEESKPSKILLSAYACEPGRGSEPAVGWNWAVHLARLGHEVWVVTRSNNREAIELFLSSSEDLPWKKSLHFLYTDLPPWLKRWKKGSRGIHCYYFLWQWTAFRSARKVHRVERFDAVHHVTFASIHQPSFMGLLGIPFLFGPVGGGEAAPYRLRRGYPLQGWLRDFLRDLLNLSGRFDPWMHLTFATASKIFVTSEQSRRCIHRFYQGKTRVRLAIGIEKFEPPKPLPFEPSEFKILFVGQLLYLKGLHFLLEAFALAKKAQPSLRLTIAGNGPQENWCRRRAEELGLGPSIEWHDWMPREDLLKLYAEHHLFLFPSLHDSGGFVVLEALANGIPVVCLDIGGPGLIVDPTCGRVVVTKEKNEREVSQSLSLALLESMEPLRYEKLRCGALRRAEEFQWARRIEEFCLSGHYPEAKHE